MNERIRELAKEHGFVRWDYDSLSYELKGDIEDLYAFAELIVRECAYIPIDMWDKAELNADVAVKIEDRIKSHFGVLE